MKILENQMNTYLRFMPLVYGCVIEQRRILKSLLELIWRLLILENGPHIIKKSSDILYFFLFLWIFGNLIVYNSVGSKIYQNQNFKNCFNISILLGTANFEKACFMFLWFSRESGLIISPSIVVTKGELTIWGPDLEKHLNFCLNVNSSIENIIAF